MVESVFLCDSGANTGEKRQKLMNENAFKLDIFALSIEKIASQKRKSLNILFTYLYRLYIVILSYLNKRESLIAYYFALLVPGILLCYNILIPPDICVMYINTLFIISFLANVLKKRSLCSTL